MTIAAIAANGEFAEFTVDSRRFRHWTAEQGQ